MLVINCVEHCWNLNPTSTIKPFYIQVFELAICTLAIRHLVCPLKFSVTFFCDFTWVLQFFQETKTMLMQIFEVQTRCIIKVARYSCSGPIPPKFEHKLRRHKQSFGKTATTVVLDKDENLLWSGLQRHRSCYSNEMTLLPILLTAVYLGTENCSSKIVHGSFFLR